MVDICLIPEIGFTEDKLMGCIQQIIDRKGHAVVCVAEGAGQALLATKSHATDASGNPILEDIGIFLRDRIKALIKVSIVQPRWGSRGLLIPYLYLEPPGVRQWVPRKVLRAFLLANRTEPCGSTVRCFRSSLGGSTYDSACMRSHSWRSQANGHFSAVAA